MLKIDAGAIFLGTNYYMGTDFVYVKFATYKL